MKNIAVITEASFMLWIMLIIHNYLFTISHLNDIVFRLQFGWLEL